MTDARRVMTENPQPTPSEMVEQLDIALHGSSWARPAPPKAVWLSLLAEVTMLTRKVGQ